MKNKLIFLMSNWYRLTDYEWNTLTVICDGVRGCGELTQRIIDDAVPEWAIQQLTEIYEKYSKNI